jgi:hypothetical protein
MSCQISQVLDPFIWKKKNYLAKSCRSGIGMPKWGSSEITWLQSPLLRNVPNATIAPYRTEALA